MERLEVVSPEGPECQPLGEEGGAGGHGGQSITAAGPRPSCGAVDRRYARAVARAYEPGDQASRPEPTHDGSDIWTWTLAPEGAEGLPLVLHIGQRQLAVGTQVDIVAPGPVGPLGLDGLLEGAGFEVTRPSARGRDGRLRARGLRVRTLADSVGTGMTLLVCGVNPSLYSADAGVGYARPGNRFWPAALAAGVVAVDRDPVAALGAGTGMTDFVKRATRTAAEVSHEEYAAGFARVSRLVAWLRPGAVCFVGLSGWRTVVDRSAVAGPQPVTVGGCPAYVMPSTSGLNARTSLAELTDHFVAARAVALGAADGPLPR